MKTPTKKYLLILIANAVLLVVVGLVYTFALRDDNDGVISPVVEVAVLHGDMAKMELFSPRKTLPQLNYFADLREIADMRDLKGQWTLVNLWASWCAPCVTELPELQKLNDVYEGQGFRVIAISLDSAQDPLEIEAIIAARHLGKIARNWDYNGEIFRGLTDGVLPISFIIGPQGKVFARYVGPANWASPEGLEFVDSLLASSKKK